MKSRVAGVEVGAPGAMTGGLAMAKTESDQMASAQMTEVGHKVWHTSCALAAVAGWGLSRWAMAGTAGGGKAAGAVGGRPA